MRTLLFALAVGLLFQESTQQPLPRFRTGIDVVLVDVTVLDKDRRPARGLKAQDFTILEDGKPQRIVSFDELDAPEPDGSLVTWMREVPPDIRTNAADERRVLLLILDDARISFRYRDDVKRIGNHIVDRLGPGDQLAVIFTGNNARSQEFTTDRKLLRAAVDRYVDTTGVPGNPSIDTLRRAIETLLTVPHRKKAILFVSSVELDFTAIAPGAIGIGRVDSGQSQAMYILSLALQNAQRANVSIYPINPAGLQPLAVGESDLATETALVLANNTGGFAIANTTNFERGIQQVFRETGSYYLLGFESPYRDGKFRRLEVNVNRAGLTVRTRNGYVAPNAKKIEKDKTLPIIKALSSVLPDPDVPVRVSAAPFAVPGKDLAAVSIVLGIQQPAPGERVAEKVEVIASAYDTGYRNRGFFRQTAQLMLRPVEGTTDAKYEILSKLELRPGRYNLRFAVNSGMLRKSGSVFQEIEIPDFRKAPISMSGVVIGVEPPLASAPKGFLSSITPVAPTTQRTFLKGHRPSAFLQVYQGERQPSVPVRLQTTIVDDDDQTIHRAEETLEFGASRSADHRFDLPTDRLSSGAYLLRFTATAGQHTASRDVRFVVR